MWLVEVGMDVRRSVLVVGLVLALAPASWAQGQITQVVAAVPSSLGRIPDGPGPNVCGPAVSATFRGVEVGTIQAVEVSLAISHDYVADVVAELVSSDGTVFLLFSRTRGGTQGGSARLQGAYTFSDAATDDWWATAFDYYRTAIPPGAYRTSRGGDGALTSLTGAFGGRYAAGEWTLRVRDCFSDGQTGAVTAASLSVTGAPLATGPVTPSTLGAIPDGPTLVAQTPGAPRDVTFAIPPGRGRVRKVRVSTTITHASVGDVVARLIAPSGESHVLFGYTGANNTGSGSSSRLAGTYEFQDGAPLDWWAVAAVDDPLVTGVYSTSALGGPGRTGAVTSMDAAFAGVPSVGIWTLRLTDGAAGQVGAISAALLILETDTTPSAFADSYSTAYGAPLAIAAPGVLSNDAENLGGALSAQLVSSPTNGTLSLAPSGALIYAPALGFVGTDTFTYRAINSTGPGSAARVSIAVAAPATVQPPSEFRASSVAGNQVTLRWKPPAAGPAATDFVVEGGVSPGQVLGAVAVGGPLPILSFPAPTGAFYLRVHAIDGAGQRSAPSNEIRVFVNTPAVPSAPTALTATANGNSLTLSWGRTFAGGAPTGARLDVTGSATASLPLSATETLAVDGVPAGTYTFRVRATNDAGAGAPSAPVTVTLPASCSGAPAPPANVLAYAIGRTVYLVWDPPATGAAPASYMLHVSGSFSGTFPLPPRNFSSPAPPGTYSLSLSAVNACGTSAQTAPQTVFVP